MDSSADTAVVDPRASAMHKLTVRNRENQRNFRLRRQQRVQELEEKLSQCQLANVQATKEVQTAARLVVAENAILKNFLREELGFNEEAITYILQRGQQGQLPVSGGSKFQPVKVQSPTNNSRTEASVLTAVPLPEHPIQCSTARSGLPCAVHQSQSRSQAHHPTAETPVESTANQLPQPATYDVQDIHRPSNSTPSLARIESVSMVNGMESSASMSCERAAEILSSLRSPCGSGDVRMQLGCESSASCIVNNVHLLGVMSETI